MDIDFLNGVGKGRSWAVDCRETINWYPEFAEVGGVYSVYQVSPHGSKGLIALFPTPGLKLFVPGSLVVPQVKWIRSVDLFIIAKRRPVQPASYLGRRVMTAKKVRYAGALRQRKNCFSVSVLPAIIAFRHPGVLAPGCVGTRLRIIDSSD